MSIVAIYAGIAGFVYVSFIAGIAVAVLKNTKEPENRHEERRSLGLPVGPPLLVNGQRRDEQNELALGAPAAAAMSDEQANTSKDSDSKLGAAAAAATAADNEQKDPGTKTADTELGSAAAAAAAMSAADSTDKDENEEDHYNALLVLLASMADVSNEQANISIDFDSELGAAAAVAAAASLANEEEAAEVEGPEEKEGEKEGEAAVAAAASLANEVEKGTNREIRAATGVAATASLANVEGVDDDKLSTTSASPSQVNLPLASDWQSLAVEAQPDAKVDPYTAREMGSIKKISTAQFQGPQVPQGGGATVAGAGALSAFLPHYVVKIVRLLVWRKAMKQDNGVGTLRIRTFLTDALLTFVAIAALDILRPPGVDDRFVVDAVLDYVLSIGLIVVYSLVSIRHALEVHILNALIAMPYFLVKTAF